MSINISITLLDMDSRQVLKWTLCYHWTVFELEYRIMFKSYVNINAGKVPRIQSQLLQSTSVDFLASKFSQSFSIPLIR